MAPNVFSGVSPCSAYFLLDLVCSTLTCSLLPFFLHIPGPSAALLRGHPASCLVYWIPVSLKPFVNWVCPILHSTVLIGINPNPPNQVTSCCVSGASPLQPSSSSQFSLLFVSTMTLLYTGLLLSLSPQPIGPQDLSCLQDPFLTKGHFKFLTSFILVEMQHRLDSRVKDLQVVALLLKFLF